MTKLFASNMASEWNMNQGFFNHLVDIIIKIDEASEIGDEVLWSNRLRILYRDVSGLLKETKRRGHSCLSVEQLDKLFDEVSVLLPVKKPESPTEIRVYLHNRVDLIKKLDHLNRELINAIHLNNLILPMSNYDPATAGLDI